MTPSVASLYCALLLKNLSHNTNVPYGNMGCQVSKIGIFGKKSTLFKKNIVQGVSY